MTALVFRFIAAVAAAYVAAVVAATQSVLARVSALGLPVDFGTRVSASAHDLVGMATSFLPLLALALLIAFVVAGLLARQLPALAPALFVAAGAAAVLTLHAALHAAFDITPVAQARSAVGLAIQATAGALGGLVFAWLRRRALGLGFRVGAAAEN